MLWLCEATIVQQIGDARSRATAEQIDRAEAYGRRDEESLVRVEGNVARIPVAGVLTKRPDFFALFFGGGNTTYAALQKAVMTAAGNPEVKRIQLDVDSYGGQVDGLFETLDLMDGVRRSSGKQMTAVVENAQSAAYALAAATGRIEARGDGATVGSIGTAVSYWVSPNVVDITNSDSPNKRPDVRTEEGKKVVVEYLDQINDVFVRAIARGRGVEESAVREGFGRGASFTAAAAPSGMVDAIIKPALRGVKGKKAMAEENQASQAQLDAAAQRGTTQERDRVLAHLTMGETSGDMKTAIEAIRSGAGMTMELQAKYLAAGMNRGAVKQRQENSDAAEQRLATSETPATTGDLGDQVVAALKGAGERSFVRE